MSGPIGARQSTKEPQSRRKIYLLIQSCLDRCHHSDHTRVVQKMLDKNVWKAEIVGSIYSLLVQCGKTNTPEYDIVVVGVDRIPSREIGSRFSTKRSSFKKKASKALHVRLIYKISKSPSTFFVVLLFLEKVLISSLNWIDGGHFCKLQMQNSRCKKIEYLIVLSSGVLTSCSGSRVLDPPKAGRKCLKCQNSNLFRRTVDLGR